ncbi:MAG TPA: hypothetical protein VGE95_01335, partial [Arthrobacter sp.]
MYVELDLVERPFTERGSRLLVLAADDGLRVARAEYEAPLAVELSRLVVRDAGGRALPVVAADPVAVRFEGGAELL